MHNTSHRQLAEDLYSDIPDTYLAKLNDDDDKKLLEIAFQNVTSRPVPRVISTATTFAQQGDTATALGYLKNAGVPEDSAEDVLAILLTVASCSDSTTTGKNKGNRHVIMLGQIASCAATRLEFKLGCR